VRILVIGNPIAGAGKAESRIRELTGALKSREHQVEIFLTRGPGDGFQRARTIGPEVERLVVVGGDGTINEVLNGLRDPSRVPLLHMAAGTANMLARDLGLPTDPGRLAELLERGGIRRIDMGIIGGRRFLLLVSTGFDAMVTEEIRKHRGKTLGYLGYARPILRVISRYRPADLEILVDRNRKLTGTNVMVLNVRHYGGYFVFSETALLDSGHFDVCVFHGRGIVDLIRYGIAGFLKRVSKLPDVTRLSCTRVSISSRKPFPVEVDGDYFGTTPVDIEIKPSAVPVVVP
jgi:diacylglycerol kinase (ATP)